MKPGQISNAVQYIIGNADRGRCLLLRAACGQQVVCALPETLAHGTEQKIPVLGRHA